MNNNNGGGNSWDDLGIQDPNLPGDDDPNSPPSEQQVQAAATRNKFFSHPHILKATTNGFRVFICPHHMVFWAVKANSDEELHSGDAENMLVLGHELQAGKCYDSDWTTCFGTTPDAQLKLELANMTDEEPLKVASEILFADVKGWCRVYTKEGSDQYGTMADPHFGV